MTLTTKLGRFIFDERIHLQMAKLIRDTLVGQKLNPTTNSVKLRSEQDYLDYARDTFKLGSMLERVVLY